ncbi:MAG: pilus assembly protein N-terminal domain-containing protein [Rhizobiaceae bacterium]|nr:pilus assembly protein N-terminal domain-containing protein [Rhizobiaceae bacterium]
MARFAVNRNGRAFAAAAIACAASLAIGAQALAESGIEVVMNQAKIVKLARPADTIVIGNPDIADASVQDAMTIVLTGKGFGVTNLVVLDSDGAPIVDEQVFVSRSSANSVRVYRRASVQTLSCTPFCEGAYKNAAEQASDMALGQ